LGVKELNLRENIKRELQLARKEPLSNYIDHKIVLNLFAKMEKSLSKSRLTEEDALSLGRKVNRTVAKRILM